MPSTDLEEAKETGCSAFGPKGVVLDIPASCPNIGFTL